jgi:hypothetical protein
MPVNLVLVAEGEEEIGSPHIGQLVHRPEVEAALRRSVGVFMPSAEQELDGVSPSASAPRASSSSSSSRAAKRGDAGREGHSLVVEGDGRQPCLALVKALDTLVSADGNTITIDNYPSLGR